MAKKRYTPEAIIRKLREAEVLQGQGRTIAQVVKQLGITEQTFYRWRKDAGALAALETGYTAAGPAGPLKSLADFLAARSKETLVDAFRIGEFYARAGAVDEAFQWLNAAVDQGIFEVIWIRVWPGFDYLHDDPRYAQLIQRIGPPPEIAVSLWPRESSQQAEN